MSKTKVDCKDNEMCFRFFRWLPIAHFYTNALYAISKLESMKPANRDYYAALDGSGEEIGVIDVTTRGFKELVLAIQKAGITKQSVDSMKLGKLTHPSWDFDKNQSFEDVRLTIELIKDHEIVKGLPIGSTQLLKDAVGKVIQRRFAMLTIVLSAFLFAIGMVLVCIDIWGKGK